MPVLRLYLSYRCHDHHEPPDARSEAWTSHRRSRRLCGALRRCQAFLSACLTRPSWLPSPACAEVS